MRAVENMCFRAIFSNPNFRKKKYDFQTLTQIPQHKHFFFKSGRFKKCKGLLFIDHSIPSFGKFVDGIIGGSVYGSLPQPSHSQHLFVGRAILPFCNLAQTAGCGCFRQNSSQVIFSVPGQLK